MIPTTIPVTPLTELVGKAMRKMGWRIVQSFCIPAKLEPHPNRLFDYDIESDLSSLHLIYVKLPDVKIDPKRKITCVIFDIILRSFTVKIGWSYFLDIPTAKRFGDVTIFYIEARLCGLTYTVIAFLYLNSTYTKAHLTQKRRKTFLWLNNFNQLFQAHHYFRRDALEEEWQKLRKNVNRVYLFLWLFTRIVIIPSAWVVCLAVIPMVDRYVDLLTNVPNSLLTCWVVFKGSNLIRMGIFLGISYCLIICYSLELNLSYVKRLNAKRIVRKAEVDNLIDRYLDMYNESFEANKFMSRFNGWLYVGTFLEALVCLYVSVFAPSPIIIRLIFSTFFNLHVTLNIGIMSLAAVYSQRADREFRLNVYKLCTHRTLQNSMKIKLDEFLHMIEEDPMGFRCFHFFRFTSTSFLLTLLELGSNRLLFIVTFPPPSN